MQPPPPQDSETFAFLGMGEMFWCVKVTLQTQGQNIFGCVNGGQRHREQGPQSVGVEYILILEVERNIKKLMFREKFLPDLLDR